MSVLTQVRILLIEDNARDVELLSFELERTGFDAQLNVVDTPQMLQDVLSRPPEFDVVLADFLLPLFTGEDALRMVREKLPQMPFIFVSGVLGETHAVNVMRQGATDYILKHNLSLLPKALHRALAEVRERRERQRAETALHETNTHMRLALKAARMGTWNFEPLTGRLTWDERCREMFGLGLDAEVTLETFDKGVHPADRERMNEMVREAISAQSSRDYAAEYRTVAPDGQVRWVATRGTAFFEHGVCTRFTGVLSDVTEQKRAEDAMQRLNSVLEERVEARTRERDRTWKLSRDLFTVARYDTTAIALNPAWHEVLGWSEGSLIGTRIWDLTHPDDRAATEIEAAAISGGRITNRFVNRIRHADGSYRWLSWTAVPDDGLMYAVARDITQERMAVDELAAANRQLLRQIHEREQVEATLQQMQRLEAVGQLTAGVAHDFNNLLTVVLSNASFLARDIVRESPPERVLKRIANIREAGERGARLTVQLLAFSRRQRLEAKPTNLNETVAGMQDLLQSTMGGSVGIEYRLQPDLWSALVDPTQIELIILNLAINARDAMEVGGSLAVSTHNESVLARLPRPEGPEPGDYVVLSVTDNGSGMDEEVLARAFEPFFTTKEVGKGSGLGLAQVYGFAKQSGGGVAIQTAPGTGTTVKVYLPHAAPSPSEVVDSPAVAGDLPPLVTARTLLVVDDDPAVREVTTLMLEDLGYRVIEAASGGAALEQLDQNADIALLVADFAMPGMNGAELAKIVRQRRPQLPIVFVTGYADLAALGSIDAAIIQKPYGQELLAEKVRLALRGAA